MPPRKGKEFVGNIGRLTPSLMDSLQAYSTTDNEADTDAPKWSCKLLTVLESPDPKEQLLNIKEVCQIFHDADVSSWQAIILQCLVNIYVECPMKHPVKRLLVSSFQNYPDSVKQLTRRHLLELIRRELVSSPTEKQRLRHIVDMLCALMENFQLGEESLQEISVESLKYISEALAIFLKEYSIQQAPVQQNEAMHHCLSSLKTANKILQKCSGSLMECINDGVQCQDIMEFSEVFARCGQQILLEGNFLLDCKSAVGINAALLVRLSHRSDFVHILFGTVFDKGRLDFLSSVKTQPWLKNYSSISSAIPETSYLCVCSGILGVLDSRELTEEFGDSKCLLIDVLLAELLGMINSDTSSKLLVAKSLTLCTSRISTCIESGYISDSILKTLHGDGQLLTRLLQYMWMTSDDQVDAIRLNARYLFENLVKLHILSSKCDIATDEFLENLMKSILEMSWSSKAKYAPFCCMLAYVCPSRILQMNPGIADNILKQLAEQSLAQYASELYQKLYTAHGSELEKTERDAVSTWCTHWVDPVLKVLCGSNRNQKTHIIEYILPKVLKYGSSTLSYVISQLSSGVTCCDSGNLGALIMCLRRARVLGLLQSQTTGDNHKWFGIIDFSVIERALCSIDEQIRLDAFALFCENVKTTERITETEFNFLKIFIQQNLNNQSPAFRQQTLSYIKKLFIRVRESEVALRRQYMKEKMKSHSSVSDAKHLQLYKDFLEWTHRCFFSGIYCGSTFGRRTACLSGLLWMIDIFGTKKPESTGSVEQFSLTQITNENHVQTLLECLTDTFEEIKITANTILSSLHSAGIYLKDRNHLASLFEVGVHLSLSTKPQDCTTAAYLFKYLLRYPELHSVICNFEKDIKVLDSEKTRLNSIDDENENNIETRTHLLVQMLSVYLMDQIEAAKGNLIAAAASRPMYPTLHVIRYLLSDVDFSCLQSSHSISSWIVCLSGILQSCYTVADVVSPVVNNSSPEGNIPEALTSCISATENSGEADDADSEKIVTLMPEYLVVCCWRSIKEVSLLLGQIALTVPVIDPSDGNTSGLLTCEEIMEIGDLFTKQLLEAIHRGAFELAYAGFIKLCEMLWKSTIPCLFQLPKQWLHNILRDIAAEDPKTKLCSTRRSAGVPFYIQAIVTTEPSVTGRNCFKQCMKQLLIMALDENSTYPLNAKIHALNILRALFRDSRLGEDVSPFISEGLKSAILGFKSKHWAVRNSATLLMSALMTRIFGVKRSKDESTLSKKNCHTGRAFFHRFPTLYQFLLEQLQDSTCHISTTGQLHLHPGLYPVLMVLGRLFPSSMEGADTNLSLSAFIPYIIRCAKSPVYKTRIMAARALQPLVIKDQLDTILGELIEVIPDHEEGVAAHSHNHGILLQILHLIEILPGLSVIARDDSITQFIEKWLSKIWLIRDNPCAASKKVALEISAMLTCLTDSSSITPPSEPTKHCSIQTLHNIVTSVLEEAVTKHTSSHVPGFTELQITSASLMMLHLNNHGYQTEHTEKYILSMLNSPLYEVRIALLNWMKSSLLHNTAVCVEEYEDTEDSVPISLPTVLKLYEASNTKIALQKVLESDQIFNILMKMAFLDENHHECISKVFIIMAYHPVTKITHTVWQIGRKQYSSCQLMKLCLTIVENSERDKVLGSVLMFIGSIMQHLYGILNQNDQDDVVGIFRYISNVLKTYSSTEQSAYLQNICADLIVRNTSILLRDENEILGELTFEFWKTSISLLQEEDLCVKETAAKVLPHLDQTILEPLQPFHTLNLLIGTMLKLHGKRNTGGCINTLIHWLHGDQSQMVYGERLFDKGEMNTYKDDVMFVDLLTDHLQQFLNNLTCHTDCHAVVVRQNFVPIHQWEENTDVGIKKCSGESERVHDITSSLEQTHISDSRCSCDIKVSEAQFDLYSRILEECISGVSSVSYKTTAYPFTDTLVYSADVIQVYRTFCLIGCMQRLPLGETLLTKCQTISGILNTKLQNTSQNLLLSPLLSPLRCSSHYNKQM